MGRRKLNKKSRQKQIFYEAAKFQENVQLMPQLFSFGNTNMNETDTSDPHRRSPESVLFESEQVELSYNDKLSPKITPKLPKTKLDQYEYNDNAEVRNEIATRNIMPLNLNFSKRNVKTDHALKNTKNNVEPANDSLNSTNYYHSDNKTEDGGFNLMGNHLSKKLSLLSINELNGDIGETADIVHDNQFSAANVKFFLTNSAHDLLCTNTSLAQATCHSDLEPRSHNNICIGTNEVSESTKSDEKCSNATERGFLQKKSNERKETVDNCYLLEKTLSMNDDLKCMMNTDLNEHLLTTTITNHSIIKTTLPITNCKLQRKYISDSSYFTICKTEKQYEFTNDVQFLLDESQLNGLNSTVYNEHDKSQDNLEKKNINKCNNEKVSRNTRSKFDEYLSMGGKEFWKFFVFLQQLNKKIRGKIEKRGTPTLSKYKKFQQSYQSTRSTNDLKYPHSSIFTSLTSPKHSRICQSTMSHNSTASLDIDEEEKPLTKEIEPATPCSSSGKKYCRTVLKFEDEDENTTKNGQTVAPVEFKNPFLKKNDNEEHSLSLIDDKMYWDSSISKSTPPFTVVLPATSDCEGRNKSPPKEEYQDDTCKHHMPRCSTTLQDFPNKRRNYFYTILANVTTFCVWLMRKLLYLLNKRYGKLRRIIAPFSFMKSTQTPRTKEFKRMVATLHSENKKMLCTLSEKVTRLSTDFYQIRINTETTLSTLTTEMNGMHEISKHVTEDNKILIQQMKELHEMLEGVRSQSQQPVPLPSSCPPPPPPLPLPASFPPPPLPSVPPVLKLPPPPPPLFPLKIHTLETSLIPPPPPPPGPLFAFESPVPIIPPTTPNSSKSNKNRTPTRKCSTPILNRPSITVEDLLKVTLKKAPQSAKDNRRNTVPGPRGPIISLDMLRNVKLKSARRRINDQSGRSPRSGRIVKSRTTQSLNISPITTRSESNLERILRQVDLNRRGPRRLLSSSTSFCDHSFCKDTQSQPLENIKHSQSQSTIAQL